MSLFRIAGCCLKNAFAAVACASALGYCAAFCQNLPFASDLAIFFQQTQCHPFIFIVAGLHRKELAAVRQKRREEQQRKHDQMLQDNSWSGILKYCGTTMLLVAIGAGSILVLDNMLQDNESKRLLVQRK